MFFYKTFIHRINQINWSKPTAKTIKHALIACTYQALTQEIEQISATIAQLPEANYADDILNAQLIAFKNKQSEKISQLEQEKQTLSQYAEQEQIDLDASITLDDHFIHTFADNFHNIRHLADTLSDAPVVIKNLQTRLYIQVLRKLDAEAQAKQLETLSLIQLQDMIEKAQAIYDDASLTAPLQQQALQLVHMGIYEIVRRECANISAETASEPQYQQYQAFLTTLLGKIPTVGASSILDTLSEFRAHDGQSIQDRLANVEEKLQIHALNDWDNIDKVNAFQARKQLFNHLRYGQDDRREYAQRIQDNLARDLFWARNIRDVELFTQNSSADNIYTGLVEANYLATTTLFGKAAFNKTSLLKEVTDAEKKLADAIKETTTQIKAKGIPLKKQALLKLDEITQSKAEFKKAFENTFSIPTVTINHNVINVKFYFSSVEADQFADTILENAGFGLAADSALLHLRNANLTANSLSITGHSISDIEQQLRTMELPEKERTAYTQQLHKIKDDILEHAQARTLSALKLNNSEEILLRQLLELRSIHPIQNITDNENLLAAFKKIDTAAFKDALKIVDLDKVCNAAYLKLAAMDENTAPENVQPLIAKAKLLQVSAEERTQALNALKAAFTSTQTTEQKTAAIVAIFSKEYTAMADTLGLSAQEQQRLVKDIESMAKELTQLIDRTQRGEPALSTEEETAYFSAIHQIARDIAPKQLADVQFKIKHSAAKTQTVTIFDANGQEIQKVKINLNDVVLPYSLIKPPHGEFIFSYGGSRGIIAPFAGLDEAYAGRGKKKGRLFTHSRLLGIGQYGSVKEVEALLTGLNQVLKKGYVPTGDETPTFKEESRLDLRTRPITARDDVLYRVECDVLQQLSQVQTHSATTQYWLSKDKPRSAGRLFKQDSIPLQYNIVSERAKGETYTDTANKQLNQYSKADDAYHNPLLREPNEQSPWRKIAETIDLSMAIVNKAQEFQALGFAHNDIKPENFLYKKTVDGHYQVKFIDWATGGFRKSYAGSKQDVTAIFAEQFGQDLTYTVQGNRCYDAQGRFVTNENGTITYGINPTLQILHGARNGTLPYISPLVLGPNRDAKPVAAGVISTKLNTVLNSNDAFMDNWALTSMIFGICNRQAYFTLVKGRVVSDYVIPGILEADEEEPRGLKIVNIEKFNAFFAGDQDKITDAMLKDGSAYTNSSAVMYIPSNQREGEPLHLYRRLELLKMHLEKIHPRDESAQQLLDDIHQLLTEIHRVVAEGTGFTKEELAEKLALAQQYLQNFEKLYDQEFQYQRQQAESLQKLLEQDKKSPFTIVSLLEKIDHRSRLEILCTYAQTPAQQEQVRHILHRVLDEHEVQDKFLAINAPGRHLFKACIEHRQQQILAELLAHVPPDNKAFFELVQSNGLLHYAAEQGLTDSVANSVTALKKSGNSDNEILDLMLYEYGPDAQQRGAAPIKWATNCLHIAIRNNNAKLLTQILDLDRQPKHDESINQALHFCAVLGNKTLFQQIVSRCDINAEKVLAIHFIPDDVSPYHLFLRDAGTLDAIAWGELQNNPALAKQFLLATANPLLIAAKMSNTMGITKSLQLAETIGLSDEEWQQLFTASDEEGKNILNHILEQGQFAYLPQLLETIQTSSTQSAKILAQLLANPHPANPLRNFLNNPVYQQQHNAVARLLLDAICADFKTATVEQQNARVIALLVNQEWFVTEAQKTSQHTILNELLKSNALSVPYKQFLFKTLKEASPKDSTAFNYYRELTEEVMQLAEPNREDIITLNLPAITEEVAYQRADLIGLMRATTQAQQQIQTLTSLKAQQDEEQRRLTIHLNELTAQLAAQQDRFSKADLEHLERVKQIELGNKENAEKAALEHAAENRRHEEALQALQLTNENINAQLLTHQSQLQRLSSQLSESQQGRTKQIAQLAEQLEEAQKQLSAEKEALLKAQTSLASSEERSLKFQRSIEEQRQALAARLGDNETLVQRTNALGQENATLQAAIQQSTEQLAALKAKLTAQQDKFSEAEAKHLQTLQEIEAKNKDDIEKATREHAEENQRHDQTLRTLQLTIERTQTQLAEIQSITETQKQTIQRNESQLQQLSVQLSESQRAHEKDQTELRQLSQLQQQLADAQKQSVADKAALVRAETDSAQLQRSIEEQRQTLAARLVDNETLMQRTTALDQENATLKAQQKATQDKLAAQLAALEAKLAAQQERFSQAESQYRQQMEQIGSENREITRQLSIATATNASLKEENTALTQKVARLTEQATLDREEAARLLDEQQAQHLEELRHQEEHYAALLAEERTRVILPEIPALDPESTPAKIAQRYAIEALVNMLYTTKNRELLTVVSRAEDNEDLKLAGLDPIELAAFCDENAYQTIVQSARARIIHLDTELERKKAGLSHSGMYQLILKEDEDVLRSMQHHMENISSADRNMRRRLNQLSEMYPIHWFNPGFQGALKKETAEMSKHFEELAHGCSVLIKYLTTLRWEIAEQLNSIPTPEELQQANLSFEHIDKIESRRQLLTRYFQGVEKELVLYESVHTQLYGNEQRTNKLGILQMVRRALHEKANLKLLSFDITTADFAMKERRKHFATTYFPQATPAAATTLTSNNAGANHYSIVSDIKEGQFREYTINGSTNLAGCFIEERPLSFRTTTDVPHASESLAPDIKLTINKFPMPTTTISEDSPELAKARIEFSFAIACQLLANVDEVPSAEKPIMLRSNSELELKFIWTALMILGKEIPYLKFDEKCIFVNSKTDLKPELGRLFGFSKSSCYQQYFKPHEKLIKKLLDSLKEIVANKFSQPDLRKKATSNLRDIHSFYQKHLNQSLTEIETEENQFKYQR